MNLKRADMFSPIGILLILANLVVFNLWANKVFSRVDLTEDRIFTLSDVTKEILRNLEEPLTVKAYFTRDLPAPYNSIPRYVEDQLSEMRANSKGNFRYEFLDPGNAEELRKEAEKFRLEPLQVNELRADRMEMKMVYLGMALIYEDKQEVIPVIQPQALGNLEYEITSKIRRITAKRNYTIGFLEGLECLIPREDLTQLDRELRKIYDIKPVNLQMRYSVPEDIDLLCVIGPKIDFTDKEKFAIDQYLMSGGKVLMAINKVNTDISQMQANRSDLRIDPWTEHYGFRVKENLVMDRLSPVVPFQTMTRYGRQVTMINYPFFPEIQKFNQNNAAVQSLRNVRLYYPTEIDTTLAEEKGLNIVPLLWSSEKSTIQSAPYDINPMSQTQHYTWDTSHLPLGAVVMGKFSSYFKDKEIPVDEEGNKVSDVELIPESPETRFVVLADANFINDQFIVPGYDNLTMMLNLVDWLVQDEGLIKIRSRDVGNRPIGEVSDTVRNTVKYANMLIPPLLVIGYGLIRWQMRRVRRTRLEVVSHLKSDKKDQEAK